MKRGKEIFEKVREHIEKMANERENNLPGLEKLDRQALTKTCLALGQMFQLLDSVFSLLLTKREEHCTMRRGLGGVCATLRTLCVHVRHTGFFVPLLADPSFLCDTPSPRVRHLGSPFFLQSFFCPNGFLFQCTLNPRSGPCSLDGGMGENLSHFPGYLWFFI
jgi:hypothetical protein